MKIVQATLGVEFMKPLVEDMTHHDPSKRPSIDEVVEKFDEILHSLSWWKLRSRLVEKGEQKYPLIPDRKSTRLNSSHSGESRMPSSA